MEIPKKIKANIRDAVASILSYLELTSFSRFPPSSLTILTFHRVLPTKLRAQYPLPGLAVTPEELSWVLSIVNNFFDIDTLSAVFDKSRQCNSQKPQLAITFDDGQWDNVAYALPVLEVHGVHATFYVPTAAIGGEQLLWHDEAAFAWQQLAEKRQDVFARISSSSFPENICTSVTSFLRYLKALSTIERNDFISQLQFYDVSFPEWSRLMNWNEISYLHRQGHEIGSHARTHNLLSQLSVNEQRQEIIQSMLDIKNAIGVQPRSLCYPDGNYNQDTLNLLKDSPFETAVTTQWGINPAISDCFQLRRCDMASDHLNNNKGVLSNSRLQFRLSRYHPEI